MACGPNLVPGRCEVPPSNGAPRNTTSYPSSASSSTRGTPRNVTSGPNNPRTMSPSTSGMAQAPGRKTNRLSHHTGASAAVVRCLVDLDRFWPGGGRRTRAGSGRVSPCQPARQPPVGHAYQLHHLRDEHQPDHGGVDQDGGSQPEADLLDRHARGEY